MKFDMKKTIYSAIAGIVVAILFNYNISMSEGLLRYLLAFIVGFAVVYFLLNMKKQKK